MNDVIEQARVVDLLCRAEEQDAVEKLGVGLKPVKCLDACDKTSSSMYPSRTCRDVQDGLDDSDMKQNSQFCAGGLQNRHGVR